MPRIRDCADRRVGIAAICIFALVATVRSEDMREWSDSTGKFRRTAKFVRLESSTVYLVTPEGASLKVPLSKLCSVDQEFVKAAVDRGKPTDYPFTEAPGVASNAAEATEKASVSVDGGTRTVVVQGVGSTPENAKKDAYREAVRQVVGMLVEPNRIIENDAVIEDRLLTLSGGFVNKAEVLTDSLRQDGSTWRVRVKAEVKVTEVVESLRDLKISTIRVQSDDLEAQRVTIADQTTATLEALAQQDFWETFPADFFQVRVTEQPRVVKATRDSAEVQYTVELSPNLDAYTKFSTRLVGVLGKSIVRKGSFVNDGLKPNCEEKYASAAITALWRELIQSSDGVSESFMAERDRSIIKKYFEGISSSKNEYANCSVFGFDQGGYGNPDQYGLDRVGKQSWTKAYDEKDRMLVLCVMTEANKSFARTKWEWFACEREIFPAGDDSPWFRGLECEVEFRSAEGSLIAGDSFVLGNGFGVSRYGDGRFGTDGGLTFISPFWVQPEETGSVWDRKGYVAKLSFPRTVAMSGEDVKEIETVKCSAKPSRIILD